MALCPLQNQKKVLDISFLYDQTLIIYLILSTFQTKENATKSAGKKMQTVVMRVSNWQLFFFARLFSTLLISQQSSI